MIIDKAQQLLLQPIVEWLNHKQPLADVPLCHFPKISQSVQPCDVLLIEGRSRVADVIQLITQSPWSHAALYVGRISDIQDPKLKALVRSHYDGSESDQLLVESELGLGTCLRPITVYELEHIRICRPSKLTDKDANDIIRYCMSCIGYQYNIRQILDLARFLFPWKIMPRRWRSSLFRRNIGDNTKTVCSTMIAEAFNFVQFPILPLIISDDFQYKLFRRSPKLCVPRDFDYSPYFEIIKYPFLDYASEQNHYHDLPWEGEFNPDFVDAETLHAQDKAHDEQLEKSLESFNEKKQAKKIPAQGEDLSAKE